MSKTVLEPTTVMLAGDVFLHIKAMQSDLRGGTPFGGPKWVAAWADLLVKSRRVADEASKQGWSKAFEWECDNDWDDEDDD